MPKITGKAVGARIRMVRGAMTQEKFAKIIGVKKQNYVSRYERGRIPNPNILAKIAEFGNTTIDWILCGDKAKKQDQ